jgi:hypothetical protein
MMWTAVSVVYTIDLGEKYHIAITTYPGLVPGARYKSVRFTTELYFPA